MTSRKVNGNYTIKKRRSRKNQNIKDGNGRDEDERWIIYTLEGCPCCTNAENMLKQHNKKVSCVEFKKLSFENREKIKSIIIEQKPQFEMTYPRIFRVKNEKNDFIGGSSDLKKLIVTQGI
jgi:glutaredoxin